MAKHKLIFTLDNATKTANTFLELVGTNRKFAFYGNMGAGKTTFITKLCEQLKAIDIVSSPTFAIVNEYETGPGDLIYHFDFYRIKETEELYDIGFEEYLSNNNWCFIEWPKKAENLLPDDFIKVTILVTQDNQREIEFHLY